MKKFRMIAIILAFWAVYYIQNHTELFQNQPKDVVEAEEPAQAEPAITNVDQKKQNFFDKVLPAVEKENARVEAERVQLNQIKTSIADEDSLTAAQLATVKKLADAYQYALPENGPEDITADWIDGLLVKVNILPQALVATQAANESAWGTSRFAEEGNNYFGQWCYQEGCGLVPLQRAEGATHEVAKYDTPQESIYAYYMNVNSNDAYAELRTIREQLDAQGKDLHSESTAIALTNGLLSYSERGQDYVNDLQSMIDHNSEYWTTN